MALQTLDPPDFTQGNPCCHFIMLFHYSDTSSKLSDIEEVNNHVGFRSLFSQSNESVIKGAFLYVLSTVM